MTKDQEMLEREYLAFHRGVAWGLAWGAAIDAMAAWARRNGCLVVTREYWTSELDGKRYYTGSCPGCGCQMKRCKAGRDEGTDNEWCGSCRY